MTNLVYNGKSFNQREDGYVNLGELCATHGKKFGNWSRLESAKDYLKALAETLTHSESHICTSDGMVVSGFDASGGKSGTWGHPLVAIEVARWINPAFGVWCNMHIKTLVETGKTEISQSQLQLPQSYLEALKALVVVEEEKQLLLAEKALLEEENHALAEAVDELFDYSSIIRIAKFNGVSESGFSWRSLKAVSIKLGKEVKRVPCPRYEFKNLYSHDVWRVCYPEYKLPETTTLVIAR